MIVQLLIRSNVTCLIRSNVMHILSLHFQDDQETLPRELHSYSSDPWEDIHRYSVDQSGDSASTSKSS